MVPLAAGGTPRRRFGMSAARPSHRPDHRAKRNPPGKQPGESPGKPARGDARRARQARQGGGGEEFAPTPTADVSPVAPARQPRSRASQQALLDAFAELMEARPFESISVADVCRQAGLSVGGFYARFAGKDALLLPLVERMAGDALQALDRSMARAERANGNLEAVVRAYTTAMVRWMARHRQLLSSVARAASGASAQAISAQMTAFNQAAHARFRAAARAREAEVTHPDPALAIDFSLFMISAAARDATTRGLWATYATRPTETAIIDELVRAWMAYLSAGR